MRFIDSNQAGLNLLGYSRDELFQLTISDVDANPTASAPVLNQIESGKPVASFEHQLKCKDGLIITVLNNPYPLIDSQGNVIGLQSSLMDITERKQTENNLLQEKTISDAAIQSHPGIFYLYNDKGETLRWNKNLESVSGYSAAEILGMRPEDFFVPEQRAGLNQAIRGVMEAGFGSVEADFQHKNGQVRPYYLTGARLELSGGTCFVGIGIDISERKKTEEEKRNLERQLLHSQKLESLGVLAGGIAHDFNNILASILGNADLALAGLPQSSSSRIFIDEVKEATIRASGLTQQMLAYSGRGRFVVAPVDLSESVNEMVNLLKSSISKKANLTTDLAQDLPAIEADAAQIQQIIMNLMTNASEAIGENSHGAITVTTKVQECSRDYLDTSCLDQKQPAGTYVSLEVIDNGCGMDKETRVKLFDPFFTTKFTGRGLGMSAVLGIVRGHKGAIMIESETGIGTIFRVLFPAMGISIAKSQPNSDSTSSTSWSGSGTVLIVDDDAGVRRFTRKTVEGMGFDTLVASNGRDGVEIFRKHAGKITCVLLDLTMPRMDGDLAFLAMQEIRNEVPVILLSGFNESELSRRFGDFGLAGFISKPFKIEKLKRVIQDVLDPEKQP